MITVEGYKAFKGIMRITPLCETVKPFELESSWLFKPDTKCWYGNGSSYGENICEIVEDFENV